MSGAFITFEGVEGCGKSTQIACLERHLREKGMEVEVTREPGGTAIAEAIREVLLDPRHGDMGEVTELLLYAAARAQHVHGRIAPALKAGKVLLCDRFADSTTAYQGAGRGIDAALLDQLHRIATGGLRPDLTFLLDLDPEEGLARVRARGRTDRLEQEALAFHCRVREGYLAAAQRETDRFAVIDASGSIDGIAAAIAERADRLLESGKDRDRVLR